MPVTRTSPKLVEKEFGMLAAKTQKVESHVLMFNELFPALAPFEGL
jgi:hypothetical protein